MDPLDCDGEATGRPISTAAALELPRLLAEYRALRGVADNDDRDEADRWCAGCGEGRDDDGGCPTVGCDHGEGWVDDCEGDCPGPRVARSGVVAIIVQANARAARGDLGDCDGDTHLCSLCSVSIPPTADRVVWTWTPEDERHPITLHAHLGCDAIRREIDLGEWTQGDLLDRLVEWADDDPLNHDLRELDANLTPEQRADMGGEIIAAAIRALDDDSECDIIRVTMDGDDAGSWTVDCCEEHDPLARVWDTAADAMAELGADLDWWEEEPNVWMAYKAQPPRQA